MASSPCPWLRSFFIPSSVGPSVNHVSVIMAKDQPYTVKLSISDVILGVMLRALIIAKFVGFFSCRFLLFGVLPVDVLVLSVSVVDDC